MPKKKTVTEETTVVTNALVENEDKKPDVETAEEMNTSENNQAMELQMLKRTAEKTATDGIAQAKNGSDMSRFARPGKFTVRDGEDNIRGINGSVRKTTEEDAIRTNSQIAIYQSLLNKRILTGTVKGIRKEFSRETADKMNWYVVTKVGPYEVRIPVEAFTDTTAEELLAVYQRRDPNKTLDDAYKIYLESRLNAEIDFVVTSVPTNGETMDEVGFCGGSRVDAMYLKRVKFWYGRTSTGNDFIKVGDKAEARIIATAPSGIRVEVFGVESYIPHRELSWNILTDCRKMFKTGDTVTVMIRDIEREEEKDYAVKFTASVKRALPDPRVEGLSFYQDGGYYTGVINYIRMPSEDKPNVYPAVFVKLEDGVQCMCKFPLGPTPPTVGATAFVRITSHNEESKTLFGLIQHIEEPKM